MLQRSDSRDQAVNGARTRMEQCGYALRTPRTAVASSRTN